MAVAAAEGEGSRERRNDVDVDADAVVADLAKLKLIGRPLISSSSSISSSAADGERWWLAIRPSPCLLHIYRCHHHATSLHEMLRFPEDPTFLLFAHPHQQQSIHSGKDNTAEASLLAITRDGCIWWIPLVSETSSNPLHRCNKRLKHNHARRISNVSSSSKTDSATRTAQKCKGEDEWDVFEDCDIYKDIDLYPIQNADTGGDHASKKKCIHFKPLKVFSHGTLPQRPEIRNITPDMLMGQFPDAHLVAVGPKNLIAVASPSSSPVLFSGNPKSIISLAQKGLSNASMYGKPSSLLFLACSKYKSQWCGTCLSEPLFNAVCPSNAGMKAEILLLQGNMAGLVYAFPIQQKIQIALAPTIICDLKEPICGLFAATLFEGTDALFVISSLGRIAVIATSKTENTRGSSLGLISGFTNLFQVDLNDDIAVRDWRVPGPVLSPMIFGSECLCFCSASNIFLINLREIKPMLGNATQRTEISQKVTMETSINYRIIPMGDVVIALSGMHSSSLAKTSRMVVALTSRGRLIAVDISDQLLKMQKPVFTSRKLDKSWKRLVQKEEENVKDLIGEIAAVEAHTEALQASMKHVDSALRELSSSLQFAYSVLRCKNRLTMQLPHQPAASSFPRLGCILEVQPLVLSVSEQRLCFGPSRAQDCAFDHGSGNILDYKLHVKLTLYNHTPYPISSFWTVMLELQHVWKRGHMGKSCFSSIINDGYGLASGASTVIDFDVVCSESCISPKIASVSLFHLNENHNDVIQESHMLSTMRSVTNASQSGRNVSSCSNEQFFSVSNNGLMTTGAVGIIIARFRLDIMNLLRRPKRLQCFSESNSASPVLSSIRLMADRTETFRPFSVKFQVRDRRENIRSSSEAVDSGQKWKEFFLEDLVRFCNSSMGGEELIGSDPNGNMVMFNLDFRETDKPGLLPKDIQITTDSLALGCMVRESVLWRFMKGTDESKFMVSIKGDIVQYVDGTLDSLIDAQRRLDAITCDMENVDHLWQLSGSFKKFVQQLVDALEYIIGIYRDYREKTSWGLL